MKHNNQVDQKKGSADRGVTGSKHGMPGGQIGRGNMSMGSSASSAGSQGNSRERKSARNGSDSNS